MAEEDVVKEKIRETVAKGGVYAEMYIDTHSDSVEGVQNLLVELLSRIAKEEGVVFYVGKIGEPITQNEIVSATAEVKILTKSLYYLDKVCSRYCPIAIEILEPKELRLTANEASFLLLESGNQAYQYSQYILKQSMGTEKYAKYLKELENRKLLGKKLIEDRSETK